LKTYNLVLKNLFLIFSFIGLLEATALGMTASVVYKDPNDRFLIIDKGNAVIKEGAHVCLLSTEGFIITCAGVITSNRTKAGLKLPPGEMSQIKVGSTVQIKAVFLMTQSKPGVKSAPPSFLPARSRPKSLPKSVIRDSQKIEEMLISKSPPKEITPKSFTPEPPEPVLDPEKISGEKDQQPIVGVVAESKSQNDFSAKNMQANEFENEQAQNPAKKDAENIDPKKGDREGDGSKLKSELANSGAANSPSSSANSGLTDSPALGNNSANTNSKNDVPKPPKEKDLPPVKGDVDEPPLLAEEELEEPLFSLKSFRSPVKFFRTEVMMTRPIFPHIAYNNVSFATINDGQSNTNNLWYGEKLKEAPSGGTAIQLKVVVRRDWAYSFGWRYWAYAKSISEDSIDNNFPNLTAETETKVDSNGFWLELGKRNRFNHFLGWFMGFGLDLDVSQIRLKSIRRDSNTAFGGSSSVLAYANSNLSVVSLRNTWAVDAKIWNVGLSLSATILLPFYNAKESFEGDASVPSSIQLNIDAEEDLKKAINHRRGVMGLEIALSLFLNT